MSNLQTFSLRGPDWKEKNCHVPHKIIEELIKIILEDTLEEKQKLAHTALKQKLYKLHKIIKISCMQLINRRFDKPDL